MGFIIYSANTFQVNILAKNAFAVIKQGIGPNIETETQLKLAFYQMNIENISIRLMTDKTKNIG